MQTRQLLIIAALCAGGTLHPAHAGPAGVSSSATASSEVLARERAWLDACERYDPEVMSDMLADDFVVTFTNGRRIDKAEAVAATRRAHAAGKRATRLTTRDTVAHVRDDVVVMTGHVTRIDPGGGREDALYTDTWVRDGGTWRVLASQMTRVPDAR
jgi:ketosteroid isomerase-like protein